MEEKPRQVEFNLPPGNNPKELHLDPATFARLKGNLIEIIEVTQPSETNGHVSNTALNNAIVAAFGIRQKRNDEASELTDKIAEADPTQNPTREKNPKRILSMTRDAKKVANEIKRRRKSGDFVSLENDLESICIDLEIESKPNYIKRILSDHPNEWK